MYLHALSQDWRLLKFSQLIETASRQVQLKFLNQKQTFADQIKSKCALIAFLVSKFLIFFKSTDQAGTKISNHEQLFRE